jgi:hypothetical protein
MATSKLDRSGAFETPACESPTTQLALPANQVVVRKNGLEFISPNPVPTWIELNVDLQSAEKESRVRGTGIVVDCVGTPHSGYLVSLIFLDLSREAQRSLTQMGWIAPS